MIGDLQVLPGSLYDNYDSDALPSSLVVRDFRKMLDRLEEEGIDVDFRPGDPTDEELMGMEVRTSERVPEDVALVCDQYGRPLYVIPLTEEAQERMEDDDGAG